MDSFRLIFPIFAFLLCAKFVHAETDLAKGQCEWSCGKISKHAKDDQLKKQYAQVQSFLNGESSCALPSDFNQSQNLARGAYQALAISAKRCKVSLGEKISNSENFINQAFLLQGLKFSTKKSDLAQPLTPSQFYDLIGKEGTCVLPLSDQEPFKNGDVLAGKDDTLIVDSPGRDPFGIENRIAKMRAQLNLGEKATDTEIHTAVHALCNDWVSDTDQYEITVLSSHGRVKLFKTYGKSSSPWIAVISERAFTQCYKKVSDAILEETFPTTADSRKSSFMLPVHGSLAGIKVLRHSSDPACRIGRTEIPTALEGLTCVQCCEESD
jgi:hypothetical protein